MNTSPNLYIERFLDVLCIYMSIISHEAIKIKAVCIYFEYILDLYSIQNGL